MVFVSVRHEKFPAFLTRLGVPPTIETEVCFPIEDFSQLKSILTCYEENQNMFLKFLTSAPGNPGSPAEPGFPRSPSGPFGFKWQCVRCNNILNIANYNINAWHKNTDIYSWAIFTRVTSIALQEKQTLNSSIMHNVLVTELLYIVKYIQFFLNLTHINTIYSRHTGRTRRTGSSPLLKNSK